MLGGGGINFFGEMFGRFSEAEKFILSFVGDSIQREL
jgi:hypothetical protein